MGVIAHATLTCLLSANSSQQPTKVNYPFYRWEDYSLGGCDSKVGVLQPRFQSWQFDSPHSNCPNTSRAFAPTVILVYVLLKQHCCHVKDFNINTSIHMYLLNAYNVPGTVLGSEDLTVSNSKSVPTWNLRSPGRDKLTSKCVVIIASNDKCCQEQDHIRDKEWWGCYFR